MSFKPKIIVCNGTPVCDFFIKAFPPLRNLNESGTSYISSIENHKIAIVLSGFVGRMDNYAKERLGKEIEYYMKSLKL